MRHPILTTILTLAAIQGYAQNFEGSNNYSVGEKEEKPHPLTLPHNPFPKGGKNG